MPPLSAYTPLESLLFFQSLAAYDTRPTSFVSISDLLRNNKFVRENGAFDAHRLSPEALEELYSTLMRDNGDSAVSANEPNGHHSESTSPSNPKKRKITSSRPDGLSDDGKRNPGVIPYLVPHLYAKYKELVTTEIRHEERRFKEIRKEIEKLEKEEREAPRQKPTEMTPTPVPQPTHESAPEPMDVDADEKPVAQPQPDKEPKVSPTKPTTTVGAVPPQSEPHKDQPPPQSQPPVPPPPATSEPKPPAQPVLPQPETQAKDLQPQLQPQPSATPQQPSLPADPTSSQKSQPPLHLQPQPPVSSPRGLPAEPTPAQQAQLPNGKGLPPPQEPGDATQNTPVQGMTAKVPPTQLQKPLPSPSAVAPSPGPARDSIPTQLPPGKPPQPANLPAPSPTPQKPTSTAKGTGNKGAPIVPVSNGPPYGPSQASFQQWSLNQPQISQQPPQPPIAKPTGPTKPPQPPLTQQTPKVEKKAQQGPQPVATPSTPQPSRPLFQSSAPPVPASGFATPIGPAQSLPTTGGRGSRPRLSINTPGSLTPWKQTPQLTLPHSPRSPDRPRPEDVSPISEKAQSPFESRAATPEEPEPPRRRGRGRKKAADADQGPAKKKGEKATVSTGRKRDRSAASSRSRGRSILSRGDESGAEPSKIKREVPSTPARINSAEAERSSAGQKGATGSEPRPGRGRPKRKRPPSEAPEPEPQPQPQPDLNQPNREDSDQSAPFVLCARNFPRTGAPIMNDVLTHKHASIFTKPLTERDAPGYRDLIYRPQDLKSIKSSISQGSKSLAAATEAANTPVADGESPVPNTGTPSKNAVLMLQKTDDVIPPKAIVNSAQLEKELIRMFANAVMFNPIPQRGFGPAFPMIADGGSGRRQFVPEPDEGGIIKDTLEMFEDVEQAVTRWRAAERTADELASKSVLSLRRESASDPNMDSADDVKG
ncbi:uncharacterized protein APUU_51196S [Aspergillus puulaauensis]|uniref:Bromo domain-containing protein n=1 Tax=Aspergillus puulaauensis TaxID=1220207 RepID=A0A7R8ARC0_9EURO|nr:uncharacterized protein APUU_51196S [Aspergillus puulaauensis]BCS26485.1 hypothetical protein APUU_51196S [Aspergillus puulaauensis]